MLAATRCLALAIVMLFVFVAGAVRAEPLGFDEVITLVKFVDANEVVEKIRKNGIAFEASADNLDLPWGRRTRPRRLSRRSERLRRASRRLKRCRTPT